MAIVYESSEMFVKQEMAKADAAEQTTKKIEETNKRQKEAMKNLSEFDEDLRIRKLEGEKKKQAQLSADYNRQIMEVKELYKTQLEAQEALREMWLSQAENELMTEEEKNARKLEINTEYEARMLEMKAEHADRETKMKEQNEADIKAIEDEAYKEKVEKVNKGMIAILEFGSAGMKAAGMITKELGVYATFQKAMAIGEATINATQSILKTMASAPYPFNVPLVALQTAIVGRHVSTIKNTKMYRGGMIPGMNTLIMANEQGREAILNPMAVRAIGGEMGVNALNRGTSNSYSYDNSRSSNIVINTSILTQKAFRDEIEPVLRRAERRR
jgi:hypothetical protein